SGPIASPTPPALTALEPCLVTCGGTTDDDRTARSEPDRRSAASHTCVVSTARRSFGHACLGTVGVLPWSRSIRLGCYGRHASKRRRGAPLCGRWPSGKLKAHLATGSRLEVRLGTARVRRRSHCRERRKEDGDRDGRRRCRIEHE